MLSGFSSGALPGDSSWAVRSRSVTPSHFRSEAAGFSLTLYLFAAAGERIIKTVSAVEVKSINATNAGAGVRFNLAPWADFMPDGYGFIEWSRGRTINANGSDLNGDRIFTGLLLRY